MTVKLQHTFFFCTNTLRRLYGVKVKHINNDTVQNNTYLNDVINYTQSDSFGLWKHENTLFTKHIVRSFYDGLWSDSTSVHYNNNSDFLFGFSGPRNVRTLSLYDEPYSYDPLKGGLWSKDGTDHVTKEYFNSKLNTVLDIEHHIPSVIYPTERYGSLSKWSRDFHKQDNYSLNTSDPCALFDPEYIFLHGSKNTNTYTDVRQIVSPSVAPETLRLRSLEGYNPDIFHKHGVKHKVHSLDEYMSYIHRAKKPKDVDIHPFSEVERQGEVVDLWHKMDTTMSIDRYMESITYNSKTSLSNIPDMYDVRCTTGADAYILFLDSIRVKCVDLFFFFFDYIGLHLPNFFFTFFFFFSVVLLIFFSFVAPIMLCFGKPHLFIVSEADSSFRTWWSLKMTFYIDFFLSNIAMLLTFFLSHNEFVIFVYNNSFFYTFTFIFFFHFVIFYFLSWLAQYFYNHFFKPYVLKEIRDHLRRFFGLRGTIALLDENKDAFDFFWVCFFSVIFHYFFFFTFSIVIYYSYIFFLLFYSTHGLDKSYKLLWQVIFLSYSWIPPFVVEWLVIKIFDFLWIILFYSVNGSYPGKKEWVQWKLNIHSAYVDPRSRNRKHTFSYDNSSKMNDYYYSKFWKRFRKHYKSNVHFKNVIFEQNSTNNASFLGSLLQHNSTFFFLKSASYSSSSSLPVIKRVSSDFFLDFNSHLNADVNFSSFFSDIKPLLNTRSQRETLLFSNRFFRDRDAFINLNHNNNSSGRYFFSLKRHEFNRVNSFFFSINKYVYFLKLCFKNMTHYKAHVSSLSDKEEAVASFFLERPFTRYNRIFNKDKFTSNSLWRNIDFWYMAHLFYNRSVYSAVFNSLHNGVTGKNSSYSLSDQFYSPITQNGKFIDSRFFFSHKCAQYNLFYNNVYARDYLLHQRLKILNRKYREYVFWDKIILDSMYPFFSLQSTPFNLSTYRYDIVKQMRRNRDENYFIRMNTRSFNEKISEVNKIDYLIHLVTYARYYRKMHPMLIPSFHSKSKSTNYLSFFRSFSLPSFNLFKKRPYSVSSYSNCDFLYSVDSRLFSFDKDSALSHLISKDPIFRNSFLRRSMYYRDVMSSVRFSHYNSNRNYYGSCVSQLHNILSRKRLRRLSLSSKLHKYYFGFDTCDRYRDNNIFSLNSYSILRDSLSPEEDLFLHNNKKANRATFKKGLLPYYSSFKGSTSSFLLRNMHKIKENLWQATLFFGGIKHPKKSKPSPPLRTIELEAIDVMPFPERMSWHMMNDEQRELFIFTVQTTSPIRIPHITELMAEHGGTVVVETANAIASMRPEVDSITERMMWDNMRKEELRNDIERLERIRDAIFRDIEEMELEEAFTRDVELHCDIISSFFNRVAYRDDSFCDITNRSAFKDEPIE